MSVQTLSCPESALAHVISHTANCIATYICNYVHMYMYISACNVTTCSSMDFERYLWCIQFFVGDKITFHYLSVYIPFWLVSKTLDPVEIKS